MKWLSVVLLLTCSLSQAGQLSLSFGPTIDGTIGERKVFTLGYEIPFGIPSLEFEVGTWNESSRGFTFLGAANLAVHVTTEDGLMVRIGVGPAAISQTNDRLSSIGEIEVDARVGLEKKNWAGGLRCTHLSNAGIVPPNLGMDFCSLYIGIPL